MTLLVPPYNQYGEIKTFGPPPFTGRNIILVAHQHLEK